MRSAGPDAGMSVARAGFAWFSAANLGTSGYLMLTVANADPGLRIRRSEQIDVSSNRCSPASSPDDNVRPQANMDKHHHPREPSGGG